MSQHQGRKVSIRKPLAADASEVAEAVRSSLAELQPWMPWAVVDYDAKSALQWMNGAFGDQYPFVIVDGGGSVVGSCGLNQIDKANSKASLGYWVRSDATGQGLAVSAAKQLVEFAWAETKLNRLEIVIARHNDRSRRVAEKMGAHYEGVARQYLALPDGFTDCHIFSVVRSDAAGSGA